MAFDLHCMCLKFYPNPGVDAWLFVRLIIPSFCLTFDVFSFALCSKLGFPHPLAFKLTHYIFCQPLDVAKNLFFFCCCFHYFYPMCFFMWKKKVSSLVGRNVVQLVSICNRLYWLVCYVITCHEFEPSLSLLSCIFIAFIFYWFHYVRTYYMQQYWSIM